MPTQLAPHAALVSTRRSALVHVPAAPLVNTQLLARVLARIVSQAPLRVPLARQAARTAPRANIQSLLVQVYAPTAQRVPTRAAPVKTIANRVLLVLTPLRV